jgi:thiopeptide-type bacteriocin biosynthesis protein
MRPAPFFVVRSPLLEGAGTAASIEAVVRAPIVHEALERASPSLVAALDGKRQSRVDVWPSVTRYVARMRGRCTPFSLMSGYALGTTGGPTTEVRFVPRPMYRRVVRVDGDAVGRAVARRAGAEPHETQWVAPRDLLLLGDVLRVASRSEDGQQIRLTDVDRSEALDRALRAAERPATLAAIVDAVAPLAAGGHREAEAYVATLVRERLLVPAGSPPVLIDDELEPLARLGGDEERFARLARAVRSTAIGEPFSLDPLEGLDAVRPSGGDLIVDLVKPTEKSSLGDDVLGAVRRLLRVLPRMTVPVEPDPRLVEFRRRFFARYEGREVPLVEAVDPRRGLGFPLLTDARPGQGPPDLAEWLLGLHDRALRARSNVEVRESDLLEPVRWALQESFAVTFALAKDPLTIWEFGVWRAPGTSLFARAAAVLPDTFRAQVREFLGQVARLEPDVDLAEVAYFIPGRSAAFTQHPRLAPMEVTLTPTTADTESSLDVNDLLVSVAGDRVRIRSSKSGRFVRIRITNAVNPNLSDTTDIYRFLAAVGAYGSCAASWRWGPLLGAPRLPRVSFEGHVLAPAEWNLQRADTEPLRKAKTREERWDAVQHLRRTHELPRHVLFHETHDLLLPVDLDDPWSVEGFTDVVRERVRLVEAFPIERSAVVGPEGPYHHHLVVPFVGDAPKPAGAPRVPAVLPERVVFDRVLPGGDVLYLSIGGDADELLGLLQQLVDEVVRPLQADGGVTHWFFLPFSDPDAHVRLRLFGDPARLWRPSTLQAFRAVLGPLAGVRSVQRVSLETYDRETYRYGGPRGIELAERVFHQSSEIALALHANTAFDAEDGDDLDAMMVVYVSSLRALLDATGLPLDEQRQVAETAAAAYTRGNDRGAPRKRGADLYRKLRDRLADWRTEVGADLCDPLAALRPLLAEARGAELHCSFSRWVVDCLHVHSVRLLTTWHPVPDVEATGYHVFEKLLGTEAAVRKERPA